MWQKENPRSVFGGEDFQLLPEVSLHPQVNGAIFSESVQDIPPANRAFIDTMIIFLSRLTVNRQERIAVRARKVWLLWILASHQSRLGVLQVVITTRLLV